jgi:hypothetical protein
VYRAARHGTDQLGRLRPPFCYAPSLEAILDFIYKGTVRTAMVLERQTPDALDRILERSAKVLSVSRAAVLTRSHGRPYSRQHANQIRHAPNSAPALLVALTRSVRILLLHCMGPERPLTSFTLLQKSRRNRINSGQTAPSGFTDSAAIDPKADIDRPILL